jgi:serine protease Do
MGGRLCIPGPGDPDRIDGGSRIREQHQEAIVNVATRRALAAGGFVIAVIASATGIEAIRQGHAESVPQPQTVAAAVTPQRSSGAPLNVANELSHAFRDVAQHTVPSVVSIQVEGQRKVASNTQIPAPFRGFFDVPRDPDQSVPSFGSGTGFVFRPDGYILTNNHVVEDADRVTVRFADGRTMDAEVVGRDPNSDIAVIKVDAKGLTPLPLGDSDAADVGDWVVATGFPLSLGTSATVTAGIISAKGRSLGILQSTVGQVALEHYIQTDAAINPGNSGGPLVDLNGDVIGVNSAIASPTGYFSGYGFAVPINIARRVADDLINHGEVRRPRLGVQIGDVNEADKEVFKLSSLAGAKVTQVQEGMAAGKAGVKLGDVIVAVNGEKIQDGGSLTERLAQKYEPGQKITLDIIRYGKPMKVDVVLGAFEPAVKSGGVAEAPHERGVSRLGFRASELSPQITQQLGFDVSSGVVVTDVDPAGSARGVLSQGIVIQEINGKPIRSLADLQKASDGVKAGDVVSMIVLTPPDGTRTILNYRLRK